MLLQGSAWSIEQTRAGLSLALGQAYASLTAGACLSMLADETALLAMGGVVAAVLVLRRFVEAGRAVESRRRAIIAALPDMIAKLMLLVGAGETVQGAFAKCWNVRQAESDHPLHKEWAFAIAAIGNGQSFAAAIERMNRSCGVQEVSVFATVLLLNYRRGGDQFVLALREFSYSIWEKRKAAARTSGEEASSKLVFPLVGILFIMMVIVAAPAFLLMS
jgi:tight adherence protein C